MVEGGLPVVPSIRFPGVNAEFGTLKQIWDICRTLKRISKSVDGYRHPLKGTQQHPTHAQHPAHSSTQHTHNTQHIDNTCSQRTLTKMRNWGKRKIGNWEKRKMIIREEERK
ncbi:hypothetical protein LR48_Vigan10g153200 [Vigna angularis]|uniref:Uncharacterized protein n=1 Tax=Phaseolus angularis TaxID=3914 RepID=A0A0L9VKR1_PHAAN|nr:hypothetical protein LR48_Vigan10g153200 [Vigna angularis]